MMTPLNPLKRIINKAIKTTLNEKGLVISQSLFKNDGDA
jgi:hypothetical protein